MMKVFKNACAAAFLLLLVDSSAWAEVIAQEGEVVDGLPLRFSASARPSINANGDVVFLAISVGLGGSITFVDGTNGAKSRILAQGDQVAGLTIGGPICAAINDQREMAFSSFVPGGRGVFRINLQSGDEALIAMTGDVGDRVEINNAGDLLFTAGSQFPQGPGIFQSAGDTGVISRVVGPGDTVGGVTLLGVAEPTLNDYGDLVFVGFFDPPGGGPPALGLFTLDGALVVEGDMIDGRQVFFPVWPSLSGSGELVFRGVYFEDGSPKGGIFSLRRHLIGSGTEVDGVLINGPNTPDVDDTGQFLFHEFFAGIFALSDPSLLAAEVENLIADVERLVADGLLSPKRSKSLIKSLSKVIEKLVDGNRESAVEKLESFIERVMGLVEEGFLSPTEGQALIDAALALLDKLAEL